MFISLRPIASENVSSSFRQVQNTPRSELQIFTPFCDFPVYQLLYNPISILVPPIFFTNIKVIVPARHASKWTSERGFSWSLHRQNCSRCRQFASPLLSVSMKSSKKHPNMSMHSSSEEQSVPMQLYGLCVSVPLCSVRR